jgi:uncharacterized membrane protein
MGTNGPGNPIILYLFIAVAASVALAAIGYAMRKRGKLRQPGPALVWAIVTILPLFGAGALMFTKHAAEQVTGETKSGDNRENVRSAP